MTYPVTRNSHFYCKELREMSQFNDLGAFLFIYVCQYLCTLCKCSTIHHLAIHLHICKNGRGRMNSWWKQANVWCSAIMPCSLDPVFLPEDKLIRNAKECIVKGRQMWDFFFFVFDLLLSETRLFLRGLEFLRLKSPG